MKSKFFFSLIILLNIIIFSFLILYLLNYILSFYYDDSVKFKRHISKNNLKYDNRSKKKVYYELKNEGENPVIVFLPRYNIKYNLSEANNLFSLSGVSNRLTIHCREQLSYSIYKSDRYGFNNPDQVWDEKKLEYLFIGDSFVHGSCVDNYSNVVSNFKNLVKQNTINLGMSGNGPLTELATLIEYGIELKPKKVFWFYYEGNDLQSDLVGELNDPILINYLKNNFKQNLKNKQKIINNLNESFLEKHFINKKEQKKNYDFSKIKNFIKLQNIKYFLKDNFSYFEKRKYKNDPDKNLYEKYGSVYGIFDYCFEKFDQILATAKELVEQNGGEFYFVYVPEYWRYRYKSFNDVELQKRYQSKNTVLKIIEKQKINLIDLDKDLFRKIENPLNYYPFGLYGHFNENGYNLIAKFILKQIKN